MKTTAREFVLFLVVLLVVQNVSGWLGTNVTRVEKNDKFTNPNRTAVGDCRASGQSSLLDTCKTFASTNTRAVCSSFSSCCESCQCGSAYSTYLPHLRKCVNLAELTSDVFGQGSSGKSSVYTRIGYPPGVHPSELKGALSSGFCSFQVKTVLKLSSLSESKR